MGNTSDWMYRDVKDEGKIESLMLINYKRHQGKAISIGVEEFYKS